MKAKRSSSSRGRGRGLPECWTKRLREAIGSEGISVPDDKAWEQQLDAWGITHR
jgi:hypothetical protein